MARTYRDFIQTLTSLTSLWIDETTFSLTDFKSTELIWKTVNDPIEG